MSVCSGIFVEKEYKLRVSFSNDILNTLYIFLLKLTQQREKSSVQRNEDKRPKEAEALN